MKQTHEIFLDFPTTEYIGNKMWDKIDEILEKWGKLCNDGIVYTMSKATNKRIQKDINNTDDDYTKLRPLKEAKKRKTDDKNSNNKNRTSKFDEDIRQELLMRLFENKLTEFIDNNGQVKDNTEKFENYCKELLNNIFINKDKNMNELFLEYNHEDGQYSVFISKDNNSETISQENCNSNSISNDKNREKIKEENIMNITNNQTDKEKTRFLYMIQQYYFDSIRKAQDDSILKIFLLSYFLMKNKIGINKDKSPADMADEFKAEDIQKQLKGKIKSDEKEQVLKEFLDPLEFWNNFEIEFSEEKEIFDYYKILYDLIPKPKIVTKEKDGKKYLTEELTKTHYRKINDLENQINEFIDNCMEDLKKNKEIQEQINNFIKEHKLQISYDKFLEDCIKTMKIKQKIRFLKTTRSNDIKIKETILDKLADTKTCGMGIYDEEIIRSYASGLIPEENIKENINIHLQNCKKCRDFFIVVKRGLEYRKKRNEQISFMLKKPYAKPVQSLTEEEYLKQSYSDYYKTNFKKNSCYTNWCYLILSLLNSGKVEEAKKIFKDGCSVYEDGLFIKETQLDLDKINK